MPKNVGRIDQYIRYGIAVGLVVAAIITGIWWIAIIAVLPVVTAYRQTCPMYYPLKISTNKKVAPK
jgi:hypothetical protein